MSRCIRPFGSPAGFVIRDAVQGPMGSAALPPAGEHALPEAMPGQGPRGSNDVPGIRRRRPADGRWGSAGADDVRDHGAHRGRGGRLVGDHPDLAERHDALGDREHVRRWVIRITAMPWRLRTPQAGTRGAKRPWRLGQGRIEARGTARGTATLAAAGVIPFPDGSAQAWRAGRPPPDLKRVDRPARGSDGPPKPAGGTSRRA